MPDTIADPQAMPPIRLADRGLVSVGGPDAAGFLHNLVSANIERLTSGEAAYAALLSPQGKVLFVFFVVRQGDVYWLDCPAGQAAALARRLGIYKLRAAVAIADRSADFGVIAIPGQPAFDPPPTGLPEAAIVYADPRLAGLGWRALVPADGTEQADVGDAAAYDRLRIGLGVPALGLDYQSGDVVPHDVNFDDLNAIDFRKGCYIGQEIVSRMKHRGTARRRLVQVRPVDGTAALPVAGTEIVAGHRAIGTMGSSRDGEGLAILRLDWVKDALDRDVAIAAGGIALSVRLPAYANFDFPATVAEG